MDCKVHKGGNMAKIKTIILLGLFILPTICIIVFMCKENWFALLTAETSLNPIEPLGIIISAALTIWIGWYITKKLTEQRFEKEYLIKDLALIEQKVNDLNDLFQTSAEVDLTHVAAKNSEIQGVYSRLEETLKIAKLEYKSDLYDSITNLYQCTTDFISPKIKVDEVDLATISARCDKVILNTRSMIFKINKN